MENNGMDELRTLIARLEQLFDQQQAINQDMKARFQLPLERHGEMLEELRGIARQQRAWNEQMLAFNDQLIALHQTSLARLERLEQRQDDQAQRQDDQAQRLERLDQVIDEQRGINARLQAILERLLPGSGNGRQEA